MVLLFVGELSAFLETKVSDRLHVDTSIEEQLDITLNITFPKVICKDVHLDLQDSAGSSRMDYHGTVSFNRVQVDEAGSTMHVVEAAVKDIKTHPKDILHLDMDDDEGCNLAGTIKVAKLPGMLHFGIGDTMQFGGIVVGGQLFNPFQQMQQRNVTHIVHSLIFGDPYPGIVNPLDGLRGKATNLMAGAFKYYAKVVRTVYEPLKGPAIISAQYSSTQYYSEADGMTPTVIFSYDVSPIMHKIVEKRQPFLEFFVNSCAIVGGTFAVCGLLDSLLYHSKVGDIVGAMLGANDKLPIR